LVVIGVGWKGLGFFTQKATAAALKGVLVWVPSRMFVRVADRLSEMRYDHPCSPAWLWILAVKSIDAPLGLAPDDSLLMAFAGLRQGCGEGDHH
jgi:hypothetical protein